MLSLSLAATIEKYRISSNTPWYVLLDLTFTVGAPPALRLARNTDDVVFKGNTYGAFAFDMDEILDKSSGELQGITLKACNINRIIEGYLSQYNGGVGATVTIYVVNAANLNGEPDLQTTFEVIGASSDAEWAYFQLGADSPIRQPIPRFMYLANHCQNTYNTPALQAANSPAGMRCGYIGALPSCDHTLGGPNGCRVHGNVPRMFAFPAIDTTGFRNASTF